MSNVSIEPPDGSARWSYPEELILRLGANLTMQRIGERVQLDAPTMPVPSVTFTPLMDGTAAIGIRIDYARADHVHPTDTSRETAGAASAVQANLTAHAAATGADVHGLGSASTHAASDFQKALYVTVPFSANPAFDCGAGSIFDLTLTGNVTASTLSGAAAGQVVRFFLQQDATGGRAFAWPANVKNASDISAAANTLTQQSFLARSDGNLYAMGPATVS